MNWIDAIILTVLTVSAIKGYSKGLILSLMGIAGLFTSIIAARLYFADLTVYLTENTPLYQNICSIVKKGLEKGNPLLWDTVSDGTGLSGILEKLTPYKGLPAAGVPLETGIAQAIAGTILSLISIILIFAAVRLAFILGGVLLNSVANLPGLKQFNRIGGVAAGLLKGALGIMLTFALMIPAAAVFSAEWLLEGIQGSAAAAYFYNNSFIMQWGREILSKIVQ